MGGVVWEVWGVFVGVLSVRDGGVRVLRSARENRVAIDGECGDGDVWVGYVVFFEFV